jgi:hypothetical protein
MRTSRGMARILVLLTALLTTTNCSGTSSKHAAHPSVTSRTQTSAVPVEAAQMNGPYKVVAGTAGTPPVTWVFTPCGDGCAKVEMGGDASDQRATARYVNMNWTIDKHSLRALQCGDGTSVPGTAHYSWNPDTLEGRYWSTADSSNPCGYGQSLDTYPVPLTLTWAGPPRAGA